MSKSTSTDTMDLLPPLTAPPTPPAAMHARTGVSEDIRTMRAIPTARVNLLPPEVLVGRQVRRVKRRMVVAIVLVILCVVAATGWSKYDASQATAGLGAEQATGEALKQQQQAYAELLRIDIVTRDIDKSLTKVMADDVDWDHYLGALGASAPARVELTGVTVTLNDLGATGEATATTPSGSLDSSGEEHIGSLTVAGLAPSHEVVADWVDTMTEVEGFLVPYILGTSVVAPGLEGIQFTIEITLSSAVRSLAYEAEATTTSGQG